MLLFLLPVDTYLLGQPYFTTAQLRQMFHLWCNRRTQIYMHTHHAHKELTHWTVDVTAQIYAYSWLSSRLTCNFWTSDVRIWASRIRIHLLFLESESESTPFFLESESGFMFFRSESESESSSKSLESGFEFESESGFGFAHHCFGLRLLLELKFQPIWDWLTFE